MVLGWRGDNHVVAGFSNNNPGPDKVEFETVSPIPLLTTNSRFITFSVNAAAISCNAPGGGSPSGPSGSPLYKFYLLNPVTGTETPTFTTPINPCASGANTGSGSYSSNGAILFSGTALKIRMRNGNGSGNGNDSAFDDIKALDATPQLDKSFSTVNQVVGKASTLTLTITNTTDLASKNGWSFTDTLPAGLKVTSPAATTTCPSGVVTAANGSNTVAVSGNLTAGMASCTVTVAVTSNALGTFTNNASNITSSVGITPPGSASVTFVNGADIGTTVNLPQGAAVGSAVNGSFTCTNRGPDSASAATCSIAGLPPAAVISCTPAVPTAAPLASSSSVVCNVRFIMPTTVSAVATGGSATPDPDLTNNSATATVSSSSAAISAAAAAAATAVPIDEPWMIVSLILLLAGVVGSKQGVRRKR